MTGTVEMLNRRGNEATLCKASSKELESHLFAKAGAFFGGIYSLSAYNRMRRLLKDKRPNVVHAHNLYPLFSPSVLVACRAESVPVVLTLHNYGLTCPSWHHLHNGQTCKRCLGGKEYWCVLKNCRDDLPTSIGYALRSIVARKFNLFVRNTSLFVALSSFARQWFAQAGVPGSRIVVVPNWVSIPTSATEPSNGTYVGSVGRLSAEKGFHTLLGAARSAGLPVRIAGNGPLRSRLEKDVPANVQLVGLLDRTAVDMFYREARFVVVPSLCFEGFPLVVAESMSHGLPVIASRIGGLPEIVDDGVTGLLFEPGNVEELAIKMRLLWENPELCRRMGRAGREKVMREYSEDRYYRRLMAVYVRAMQICESTMVRTSTGTVWSQPSIEPSTRPSATTRS